MGQYTVIAPCAYLVDGKAIVHRRTGVIVEVSDETAAGLPGVLVPLERPIPDVVPDSTVVLDPPPTGQPVAFVDAPPVDHAPGDDPVVETREGGAGTDVETREGKAEVTKSRRKSGAPSDADSGSD